ncbi:MAG: hypothetical protein Tsb0020_14170 [Haliangiales bacterium]
MSLDTRAYSAGQFLFTLDDRATSETTWLKSVDGGGIKGSVIQENIGPDFVQIKHLATVEIEPLTLEVGLSGSRSLLEWIQESFTRSNKSERFSRRNGSIIHADYNQNATMEYWFYDALISEVSFPSLDGGNNSPAYATIKFQPERFETKSKSNTSIKSVDRQRQKLWSPSNFRLDIRGIDCRHVNKIESFTIKQKIKPLYFGTGRFPELEPAGVEIPNLSLTIASAYADDFVKWHNDFVVKGGKDPEFQKTGSIEFLDPKNDSAIFTIGLDNVGINHLNVEKSEGDADAIKRTKVELFVESMNFEVSGSGLD